MSYTIRIGEPFIRTEDDCMWIDVHEAKLKDAPTFPGDDMTGNSNDRSPSYAGWSQFCDKAGLKNLFFNKEDGLMREHPGCFPINEKALGAVKDALKKWQAKHPGTTPGWCECKECRPFFRADKEVPHSKMDDTLARLIWLEWWMTWAIKKFDSPAIYNS